MEDTWHTSGNSKYHTRPENKELIELLKSKYRKREELVPVGPTGYPACSLSQESILKNTPSWAEDGLGRFHFFTGKPEMPLIFQRYTQGHVMVGYKEACGWEGINKERLEEVMAL